MRSTSATHPCSNFIDPTNRLPVCHQARLLGIARSTVYEQPRTLSERDAALMAAMDRLHLEYPFAGARLLRDMLRAQGFEGLAKSTTYARIFVVNGCAPMCWRSASSALLSCPLPHA